MKLYTVPEAAAMLGMSVSWLQKKVARREVPFREFGRSVRFSDADLAEIVAAAAKRPVREDVQRKLRAAERRAG